jgi:hypothetical protein
MIITNQFCYYLSAIPATSVPSESAFSTVTRLLDDYRSRLSADTVEALMICRAWLEFTEQFGKKVPKISYIFPNSGSKGCGGGSTSSELDDSSKEEELYYN